MNYVSNFIEYTNSQGIEIKTFDDEEHHKYISKDVLESWLCIDPKKNVNFFKTTILQLCTQLYHHPLHSYTFILFMNCGLQFIIIFYIIEKQYGYVYPFKTY
jgi:hypothetical protein